MKNYLPGMGWALLIFILSTISTSSLMLPNFWDLFSLDKVAHALFYFLLYLLWARGFRYANKKQKQIYIILLLSCITYGALLELFQRYFLTYRNGDWVDELANTIGALAGFIYINRKGNGIVAA